METPEQFPRISRRVMLKWFATAAAAMQMGDMASVSFAAAAAPAGTNPGGPLPKGYGQDPDLSQYYKPGDFWKLTLTPEQRKTATALVDLILPADHLGPAASSLRIPDFIDEWVSAPYPEQAADAKVVLPGLKWLEDESQKRFKKDFASLNTTEQRNICDDICWAPDAKPEFKKAADFFSRFRNIAAGAYYGTPEGWKAIGYVGNEALTSFDGPPKEVLEKLGVTQTVK
jgi:hypothetical protein